MKVTGTWQGEYTYGPGYETLAGKSVPFVLSLTESWLQRFAGYVRDDASKGGQPERGRIAGKRSGTAIEFVKTMPVGYVTNEDNKMEEESSWLRRVFGVEQPETSPHRILYSGELSADGQSAAGKWLIQSRMVAQDGDIQHVVGGEGTWTARRVSDLPTEV
jgi:hypothetical protein